ncbi:unnamed protein product [Vitrella brassicaformis CCMP3155]|uniref:Uncharacterized protein n=1 Tax=Vitrella brassicaformis (strain CCMP3155) TaxID=1169540 RepID=A0A0G4FBF3_VITBC|nr:unnamed protein product [Vitrella brassicaformis CCMP3155]|eukprot:CEM09966.1 unnamed protein product [Vitrella brassicaformis CCMP3155]
MLSASSHSSALWLLLCGVQQAAWHRRQMLEQLEVEVSYAKPAKEHKFNNALPAMPVGNLHYPPSAPTTSTHKTTTHHTAGSNRTSDETGSEGSATWVSINLNENDGTSATDQTSSACPLLQDAWLAVKGAWEGVTKMVAGCCCTNLTNVA